jgi:hypothetical protein
MAFTGHLPGKVPHPRVFAFFEHSQWASWSTSGGPAVLPLARNRGMDNGRPDGPRTACVFTVPLPQRLPPRQCLAPDHHAWAPSGPAWGLHAHCPWATHLYSLHLERHSRPVGWVHRQVGARPLCWRTTIFFFSLALFFFCLIRYWSLFTSSEVTSICLFWCQRILRILPCTSISFPPGICVYYYVGPPFFDTLENGVYQKMEVCYISKHFSYIFF